MSILDEELVISDDSDFENLFPTKEAKSGDDDLDTEIEDAEYEVEEAPKKKRGRPAKAVAEKKSEEEPATPKKRGRPAKKKVVAVIEEEPQEEVEEEPVVKKGRKKKEPVIVEEEIIDGEQPATTKKTRAKRVSVDDIDPEILEHIFEEYSQRPTADLAEEFAIPEKHIHKAIERMNELFEMSISTGDLTQEDYDEFIAPKMKVFSEPKDSFEVCVKNAIKKIKGKKK